MPPEAAWHAAGLAAWSAALFAVDPRGIGGVWLRSGSGPTRDAWLDAVRAWLPVGTPWRRVPLQVDDARLLGGLDLGATLRSGRPVAQPGLLAQADGGVVVVAMAERVSANAAARFGAVLDQGEVALQRDGFTQTLPARLGLIALDEGLDDDEAPPAALLDRLGLAVELQGHLRPDTLLAARLWTADEVAAARHRLPEVQCDDATLQALCATALSLGIASLRPACLALRVAKAAAALGARVAVSRGDAELAAQLVLAPRATQLAAAPPPPDESEPADPHEADANENDAGTASSEPPAPAEPRAAPADRRENTATQESDADDLAPRPPQRDADLDELILQAARAAIPRGLLARLAAADAAAGAGRGAGRAGALQQHALRGRPIGARRGEPSGGARLDLLQTLRAAAPWQRLRDRDRDQARQTARNDASSRPNPARSAPSVAHAGTRASCGPSVRVRREDFHVRRFKQRRRTCTVFAVDASGSAALNRLAEAKGAVELLLAECYVRRDRVALIAFRGVKADLLLPPTRSLVRAKRSLAGLPGGGGTPLAAGIVGAAELARGIEQGGETAVVVLLTDGRANIALDGTPGRERAHRDALLAAHRLRDAGIASVLLDIGAIPQAQARELAAALGGRYIAMPFADAALMARALVRGGGG